MSLSSVAAPAMLAAPARRVNEFLRTVVAAVAAGSVGVHAGIIPAHVDEGATAEVVAFGVTSAALLVLAVLLLDPRHDRWAPALAAGTLVAVAVAYLLSRPSGLPLLVPDAESLDLAGLVTSLAEVVGAAAGITLFVRIRKEHR